MPAAEMTLGSPECSVVVFDPDADACTFRRQGGRLSARTLPSRPFGKIFSQRVQGGRKRPRLDGATMPGGWSSRPPDRGTFRPCQWLMHGVEPDAESGVALGVGNQNEFEDPA